MLRKVAQIGCLTLVLIIQESITETPLSLLSFLRGGSTAVHTVTKHKERLRTRKSSGSILAKFVTLRQGHTRVDVKVQPDVNIQWNEIRTSVEAEWTHDISNVTRIAPYKYDSRSGKLDEVLKAFEHVLHRGDLDTAQLLKACWAHLALMKSGGSSLSLVARDFESNLQKAESLFKKSPQEGKYLASLLEIERRKGLHDGNLLRDPSAAVGLLWIRRSLAFQLDLYASLIPTNGQKPRDAAMDAYYKHLSPYHGWVLRKVFPVSFSQIPEREIFMARFGGINIDELEDEYESQIVAKIKALVEIWRPILETWKNDFERLDMEDKRRV